MMYLRIQIILVCMIFLITSVSNAESKYRVVRSDRGSIVVRDSKGQESVVQLAGVSLPDSSWQPAMDNSGFEDLDFYISDLLDGQDIYIRFTPEDSLNIPGSNAALIYRLPDSLFVNREIIRRGYGFVPAGYSDDYMQGFMRYQEEAKQQRLGYWSLQTFQPYSPMINPRAVRKVEYIFNFTVRVDNDLYHRPGCDKITDAMPPMKVKAAQEKGLSACEKCELKR